MIDGSAGRFFRLPTKFDIHEYNIMDSFVDSLPSNAVKHQLENAIRGKGAFRRFKDTINHLGIAQQWYNYQAAAYREIAVRWFYDNGL